MLTTEQSEDFLATTRLAQEWAAKRDAFYAHRNVDAPKDEDTEEFVRWTIDENRLLRATCKADAAYRASCDNLFGVAK